METANQTNAYAFYTFFINKREYSFSEIVIENSTLMNKCV